MDIIKYAKDIKLESLQSALGTLVERKLEPKDDDSEVALSIVSPVFSQVCQKEETQQNVKVWHNAGTDMLPFLRVCSLLHTFLPPKYLACNFSCLS